MVAPIICFISTALPTSLSEVASLRFKLSLTLHEARQEADQQVFLLLSTLVLPLTLLLPLLPKMFLHPPTSIPPPSYISTFLSQSNSFANLSPRTPISTTAPTSLPPCFIHSRQSKRSIPCVTPSPPPTSTYRS